MIYFATEVKSGEECIIKGYEYEPLIIRNLNDEVLMITSPSESWSHEKLMAVDLSHLDLDQGADAYLDKQWIGSTEC